MPDVNESIGEESRAGASDSTQAFLEELRPVSGQDRSNQQEPKVTPLGESQLGTVGMLDIPTLIPSAGGEAGTDAPVKKGHQSLEEMRRDGVSLQNPIANLAEEQMGERPYKTSAAMRGVQNPGEVAQADFVSKVLAERGFDPEIGNINGHVLAHNLDERPDLFEKIDIKGKDFSELQPGDLLFGFRSEVPGRARSQVGVVGNDGNIVWASSRDDGQIQKVSQQRFSSDPSLRRFVAYRNFLGF